MKTKLKIKQVERQSFHSVSTNRPQTCLNSASQTPRIDSFQGSPLQRRVENSAPKIIRKQSVKDRYQEVKKQYQIQEDAIKEKDNDLTEIQKQNRFKYNNLTSLSNQSWNNFKSQQQKEIHKSLVQNQEFKNVQPNKYQKRENFKKNKSNSIGLAVNHEMAEYKFEEIDYMEVRNQFPEQDYEDFKLQYMVDKNGNYMYQKKQDTQKMYKQHTQIMDTVNQKKKEENINPHIKQAQDKLKNGIFQKITEKAKKQSDTNSRIQMIQNIKNKTWDKLDQKLQGQKVKQVIEESKQEVLKAQQDMTMEVEKLLRENQVLKKEIQMIQDELVELRNDNENQQVKNKFINEEFFKCNQKFDNLKYDSVKLEKFIPEFEKICNYFNTYNSEQIIKDYDQIKRTCNFLQQKLSDIEMDQLQKDKEQRLKLEDMDENLRLLQVKDEKREKAKEMLQDQIKSQKQEYINVNQYQQLYINLTNQIIYLFNEWKSKIKVYPLKAEDEGPVAHMKDPIQMLQYMEKMIKISTNEKLQAYLRKIIVNAHIIQRKYLNGDVNEKFDPDKIYDNIAIQFNKLNQDIITLKQENKELKSKCKNIKNSQIQNTEDNSMVQQGLFRSSSQKLLFRTNTASNIKNNTNNSTNNNNQQIMRQNTMRRDSQEKINQQYQEILQAPTLQIFQ